MCFLRKPTKTKKTPGRKPSFIRLRLIHVFATQTYENKKTPCFPFTSDENMVFFCFLWFSPLYTIFSAIYNLQYKQRINLMCIHCHFVPVSAEGISVHILFIGKHTNGIRCAALLQRKIIQYRHTFINIAGVILFFGIRSRLWSHPSQPDSRRLLAALRNPALRRHFWRTGK